MGWTSQIVVADQVIVEGTDAGLFVYNGTAGPGTLIASITGADGTDDFGNATHAVASFGNQAGAFLNIDASGNLRVTNSAGKVVLLVQSSTGATLVYSAAGGAGPGNLIIAQAPAAGTDPSGNTYPKGYTVFGPGSSYVNMQDGKVQFQGAGGQFSPALVQTADTAGFLDLTTGMVNAGDTQAELFLESTAASGGTGSTISMTASHVLVNGHDLTTIFGILDPSGYPLSGSATLSAVITTLNSTIQRLQNVGIFQ